MLAGFNELLSTLSVGELRTSGVLSAVGPDGEQRTLRIERIAVRDVDLQTAVGPLRAASVELSDVTVRVPLRAHADGSRPRLPDVAVGELRLKGARIEPRGVPQTTASGAHHAWRLEPLAALDGTLRAEIVDAHWIFDADVTVPISGGRIDFNRATVEHVGPDSSMGISRMGIYVDAPNGRTYLFLLSATHVPGARFEQRGGGLLSSFGGGDRGAIELRPLLECALSGTPLGALATGTRDMAARTRVRGEFRLGDGVIGDDRSRVVLSGRDAGRNRVELSSAPSGRGIVVRVAELSIAELRWQSSQAVVSTGALSATLAVQVEDAAAGTPAVSVSIAELALRDIVATPIAAER
jgi:hypothetical protein